MDVPAPTGGTVTAVQVAVGDTVSVGTLIVDLSTGQAGTPPATAPTAQAPTTQAPAAAGAAAAVGARRRTPGRRVTCTPRCWCSAPGPGGYTAAFRAADLGRKVVMVDSRGPLGGVCLNVGCIPSKALLHAAKVIAETKEMSEHGLSFAAPTIDLDALRTWKDGVVGRLTGGLTGLAKQRKVTTVVGTGTFTSPNMLSVAAPDGSTTHGVLRLRRSSRPAPSR